MADKSIRIRDSITFRALATPPSNPEVGDLYVDSNDSKLKIYDGSDWADIGAVAPGTVAVASDGTSTDNGIPLFIGTDGSTIEDSGMTYNSATLAGMDAIQVNTTVSVGDLFIESDSIYNDSGTLDITSQNGQLTIATGNNQDIRLMPDGTGRVLIDDEIGISGNVIQSSTDNIQIASSNNGAIILSPDGTGQVNVDEIVVQNTTISSQTGSMTISGTTTLSGIVELVYTTNAALTGSNASLTPSSTATRVTNASLASIANVVAPSSDQARFLILSNVTGNSISIVNDASGTAANRILTGTGLDLTLTNNASIILVYDGTTDRWRVVGGSGGGSSTVYTSTRVPFGDGTTTLAQDADLTFDSSTNTLQISTSAPGILYFGGSSGTVIGDNVVLSGTTTGLVGVESISAVTDTIDTGTDDSGYIEIITGDRTTDGSGNSGDITIMTGSNADGVGDCGDILIKGGNNTGGNYSGSITLQGGTGSGLGGRIYLKDGTQSSTNLGAVYTETEVGGVGGWVTPSTKNTINYISNGGFEYIDFTSGPTTTVGWVTYADAAGSRPVDGTGGSPASTFVRSTSNPLTGTASGLLTKSAANRQGEGVSYQFTIDRAYQLKPEMFEITFDYEVSGTFSYGTSSTDSDVCVYVVDATSGAVIQPSGYKLDGGLVRMTFQPTYNSTTYRLCFHIATTSASAYTLKIDNVKCGPQVGASGPAMSDWTSYTPTGSWVTNTNYTGRYRRVGDTGEFEVLVSVTGAPTATQLTVNLPSGLTIDTTKLTSTDADISILGVADIEDVGTSSMPATVIYDSTTAVRIISLGAAAAFVNQNAVNSTTPMTWANGDQVKAIFRAPILGWSSNTLVSDSADTRVVAFRAHKSSGSHSSSGNFQDVASWSAAVVDTHGAFNATTGEYTVKVPGWYEIDAAVSTAANSTGSRATQIMYDGSAVTGSANLNGNASSAVQALAHATIRAEVGKIIKVQARQDSGGSLNYDTTTERTYLCIRQVSGPSQVAASEVIAARYSTTAGQSVANSGVTLIDFGTKVFDTHGAVTTGGSWKFTAPAPGLYRISNSNLFTAATYAVGNVVQTVVYKNGSVDTVANTNTAQAAASLFLATAGVALISLNAGEYIDIRLGNNRTAGATTLSTVAAENTVSIERIGGVL